MRCNNCGVHNRDDAKFCRKCGKPLGPKVRKRPKMLILSIVVLLLLVVAGTLGLVLRGRGGDVKVDKDGNYVFNETIIEEIDVSSSSNVPSVVEIAEGLGDRGFVEYSLTSGYGMDGSMLEDEELDQTSTDKHPLYNVFYVTPEGRVWVIYVCNGAYMANPLFMYDPSKVPCLLVEDEYVTSYSSDENKFIRTVPDKSELVMKRVTMINAETLDALDEKGVEAL